MLPTLRSAWPARRRLATLVLFPVVGAWFLLVGVSSPAAYPLGWYAAATVAAVLGAGVLASYLPVAGGGLDLGCTPCATFSALTLVGATMALRSYGADLAGPLVAIAVLLFGLSQRMGQPAACVAPAPEPARIRGSNVGNSSSADTETN
jgi:hypothetical protein